MTADLLRRAASHLREAACAADMSAHTFWPDPWKVEASISVSGRGDLLDIVSQGDVERGAVQYIADAETPQYATWIAMMSTQLAEPLALILEEAASRMDTFEEVLLKVWGTSPTQQEKDQMAEFLNESKPSHAIAIARVILGEEEGNG